MTAKFSSSRPILLIQGRFMQFLSTVALIALIYQAITAHFHPSVDQGYVEMLMSSRFFYALCAIPPVGFAVAKDLICESDYAENPRWIFPVIYAGMFWFGTWMVAMIHACL